MRPLSSITLLGALAGALLTACYTPNVPDGQQQCSDDGLCPEGLTCFKPNGRCYRVAPTCAPSCTGNTPACDLSQAPPKCVACLGDRDCPVGTICDVKAKQCHAGCSRAHPGCAGDAGSCDVDAGLCRGCNSDDECAAGDPNAPRCDVATGQCQPCLPQNDNCPRGKYCIPTTGGYACTDGCRTKDDCDQTLAAPECCDHRCVDTAADAAHCGGCGRACGMGQSCCGSGCVDPMTDLANCGGCMKACPTPPNAAPACVAGTCGLGACANGFGDCNGNAADGCEANLGSDPLNCRTCKNACPIPAHATPVCAMGTCGIGPCAAPWLDCDKTAANGCEANPLADVKNCGACGNACNLANAVPGCGGGFCVITSCNPGFGDCDRLAGNGCETALQADANNCGACGKACALANAASACAASTCTITSCNAGFADCDKAAGNGCEVNTQADPANCGACGKACSLANAVPGCAASACTVASCNAGFGDCDRLAANGCEKSVLTDVNNCGSCGRVCSLPNAVAGCAAGACTVASCATGYADCNKLAPDGCEANTQTDANNCGGCGVICANGRICKAGACVAGAVTYGPTHTFLGTTTDFYLSTGQGCCSVNCAGIAADDAAYFCLHFYAQPLGKTCSVVSVGTQAMQSGWMMHKNSGCTSSGSDIPNTTCDGGACKLWNSAATYSGLKGIVCQCM